MITFDHVTKRYGERVALSNLSWHMEEGECVVFLGASGAGKTTLLRLITHETAPTSGRIVVGTFQGSRLGRHQRALLRRTLGIVYEDFRLLDDRTVFDNVALAVHITGRFREEDVVPQVQHALEEVGLESMSTALPRELSAGEKQRAAIARAIVNRPAVILADEPTGALEDASAAEILERLRAIHAEGAALILVTTRREVAQAVRGRLIELDHGALTGGQPFPPEGAGKPARPRARPEAAGEGAAVPEAAEATGDRAAEETVPAEGEAFAEVPEPSEDLAVEELPTEDVPIEEVAHEAEDDGAELDELPAAETDEPLEPAAETDEPLEPEAEADEPLEAGAEPPAASPRED